MNCRTGGTALLHTATQIRLLAVMLACMRCNPHLRMEPTRCIGVMQTTAALNLLMVVLNAAMSLHRAMCVPQGVVWRLG